MRKTGFTIAPEAGTKKLRNGINKDFSDEEYDETLQKLFSEGWKNVKLYFMIGLPTETMSDIDGLINMAARALKNGKETTGKRVNINVGISAFVPKPHTPFQWTGQNKYSEIRRKQDYIRKAFKRKGIKFKGQHVESSLLEAVFSRADKDSSLLLESAWKLGCRFDGWAEQFNFDKWLLASEKAGIDLHTYASRTYDTDDELPWDFIDTGITKKFLLSEYKKALQGIISSDCRDTCHGCGLECKDRGEKTEHITQSTEHVAKNTGNRTRRKMRVKFSKTGDMRCLSHNELMTSVVRAMRRAGISLAHSAGFHPHPKISFGPALAAGVEGLNEFFDIEITSLTDSNSFLERLNAELPEGLRVLNAALIHGNEESLNNLFSCYEYEIIIDKALEKQIHSFMGRENCQVSRKKRR